MSVAPPKQIKVEQVDAALKELAVLWQKERVFRDRVRLMNKIDDLLDMRNKLTKRSK